MRKIYFACAAVFLCSVCNAQFFYNDDEQQQPAFHDPTPPEHAYGRDNYATVAQPNLNPQRSHSGNFAEPINYQPAPPAPPAAIPPRPNPNHGQGRRSRQRQQQIVQLQPPPRRVYSPSVFENLALGMPPAGVNIPENSFLNVLRNDGRGTHARHSPVYEPSPPQRTSFVQSPPAQTLRPAVSSNLPYSAEPATAQRARTIEAPPAQIDHWPQAERFQPELNRNPVEYQAPQAPVQVAVQPVRQQSGSRRRSSTRNRQITSARSSWNSADEEPQRPPRVFSPSVFEKLDLGVAPRGVHVPENSLLNILRDDRPNVRTRRNQVYQPEPSVAQAVQYVPDQYSDEPSSPVQPHSTEFDIPKEIQNVEPAPRRVNRHPQQQRPQPKFVAPQSQQHHQQQQHRPQPEFTDRVQQQQRPPQEFVDDSVSNQGADVQLRVHQQPKPVQNRRKVSVRRHRQYSGSITDADSDQEEFNQPPKQYAPSIFENVGLGEAPPGIYYPEDSFLNLLRGERPVSRPVQRQRNQQSHVTQAAPYANQPAPQQHQNVPPQQYQEPVNIQPQREYRRPAQEINQRAIIPQPTRPPKRQRQRSRTQSISAPQSHPVQNAPEPVYDVNRDLLLDDDILRYRPQDNSQRIGIRQNEHVPQRKRTEAAPRHLPQPPQPAYEAPQPAYEAPQPAYEAPQPAYEAPQPSYDANARFQHEGDIPRRRTQPGNQRRAPVQQPVQRQRTDTRSHPVQSQNPRHSEVKETRQQPRVKAAKLSVKPLPDDVDGDQIPGERGVDYPTLHVIPKTSFSCIEQPHNGYYADLETSCQVVHMCQAGGVQSSFLCPNGTIFNQEKFSCQWWYKVNCADAPSHYGINDRLYKVPPPPARRNKK